MAELIEIGRKLPDISLQTIDDEPFRLSQLNACGRSTLLIVLRHLA